MNADENLRSSAKSAANHLHRNLTEIMILDLRNRGKGDFHDLSISDLDFDAGRGEGLGRFHAPHCATHSPAVGRNDLDIVFTVKGLQGRERFGYFHTDVPP